MAAALRARCGVRSAIKFGRFLTRSSNLKSRNFFELTRCRERSLSQNAHVRYLSSQAAAEPSSSSDSDHHSIIKDTEKATGQSERHEFQTETRQLLDIVAKSLYSEKEVFIRELISNASDALEKLRYLSLSSTENDAAAPSQPLEIHIATDKQNRILTIQDTGVGMTREELTSNLGTIARSGSKAFLEQIKGKEASSGDPSAIIGQFGVGFYSAFMVADKVEVFTKSYEKDAEGLHWQSDGSGTYEISTAEGVQPGTKIVLHLRVDCREFSDDATINNVIKKYSNFVGSPIFVNGKRSNVIQPLWMLEPKDVKPEEHAQFFRFIANSCDTPRFTLHYSTDVPLSIRALLYFPEGKPGLFEMSRDTDIGVSLYSRKILIKSRAENILPKWLRFVKGVVDSEDIPLNLSRELLQNSALIGKLRNVLTSRILRFLYERSTKQPEEYEKFYKDYGLFLKEGVVSSYDQQEKEEISKLLRFESSTSKPGELVSIPQYCSRLAAGQKDVYYLAAPSRVLAEQSPYYEALKKRNLEVLFCYEPYDELVLMQLREYNSHPMTSVEKEMRHNKEDDSSLEFGGLDKSEADKLVGYLSNVLKGKAFNVKITSRLESHPCVVTVEDMAAARHFLRTQSHQLDNDAKFSLLQPRLEINPKHPIIKKLSQLATSDPKLAELVTQQLFANAMVGAGLMDDPRSLLTSMNELLTLALEKH
ncbi:heat shock protein 75 kDa, mitochondrial [Neodiprion virginianus]|uniref:heat shock protein 75 kDa, mitochondrial n=1 Tax=Neodiprion virginianus TaxID=2961670 RepID=UPI001EE6B05F|nr:heat shock protein 75 kDa, mitochondrial [Neodiprion virginianus]